MSSEFCFDCIIYKSLVINLIVDFSYSELVKQTHYILKETYSLIKFERNYVNGGEI